MTVANGGTGASPGLAATRPPEKPDRPRLPVRLVEFHVAHHCNLTCAGCSHFSPEAARHEVTRQELEEDLAAANRALAPEYVHILGGEPLLNRGLAGLVPLFRDRFPIATIKLVTNGVLLLRQPTALYHALRANRVVLAVSIYPGVPLDREAIRERCRELEVALEEWEQDTFLDFFDPEGGSDPLAARAECPMEDALNVRDGRLFPCPITAWADLGGLPFEPADGVPLPAPLDRLRSVLRLDRPTSLCRHCRLGAARVPHRLLPLAQTGSASRHAITPRSP